MDECLYIEVIVPLRLSWAPCYRCNSEVRPGQRVTVPVAGRRYVGVVHRTGIVPDIDPSRIQEVVSVNDELPDVSLEELRFWEFLASYYLCSIGEVYKAAYPSGKIRSEQKAASILDRLRQRLAIREEALSRKHRDNVRERLEAERDAISRQIDALTRIPDSPAPIQSPQDRFHEGSVSTQEAPAGSPGGQPLTQEAPASTPEGRANIPVATAPTAPLLLTGPNRTQRYVTLCRETIAKGLNVLVLLPEIAASEQLEAVFEEHFPGVTHRLNSHVTDARRRSVAEDIRHFGGQIVTGTRSALFLPFSRLGLVIVEQEQDAYYKQTEPAPRYNARDAAVVLARIHGAKVVLGTPAPSLESLYNVLMGKYIREDLPQDIPAPILIDVNAERRKNGMLGRLSRKLLEIIAAAPAPSPQTPDRTPDQATHTPDQTVRTPDQTPTHTPSQTVQTPAPVALIRGWEKPEELLEDLAKYLPGRHVDVLTAPEARLKDLSPYAVVAILQADALMNADDFRADERALQAIAQLRENVRGAFVIQTAKPDHPVYGAFVPQTAKPEHPVFGAFLTQASNPLDAVYAQLLEERRQFSLPPFARLVDTVCGNRRERITLAPDGTLAARKKEILGRALQLERTSRGRLRTTIDVDPL